MPLVLIVPLSFSGPFCVSPTGFYSFLVLIHSLAYFHSFSLSLWLFFFFGLFSLLLCLVFSPSLPRFSSTRPLVFTLSFARFLSFSSFFSTFPFNVVSFHSLSFSHTLVFNISLFHFLFSSHFFFVFLLLIFTLALPRFLSFSGSFSPVLLPISLSPTVFGLSSFFSHSHALFIAFSLSLVFSLSPVISFSESFSFFRGLVFSRFLPFSCSFSLFLWLLFSLFLWPVFSPPLPRFLFLWFVFSCSRACCLSVSGSSITVTRFLT